MNTQTAAKVRQSKADELRLVLTALLDPGTPRKTVDYLAEIGLDKLSKMSLHELTENGISSIAASRLLSAFLVAKLSMSNEVVEQIRRPSDAYRLLQDMRYLKTKHYRAIIMNPLKEITAVEELAGNANPLKVLGCVLDIDPAAKFILAHNHPHGVPNPTDDDIAFTQALVKLTTFSRLKLLDHVIIAAGGWVSLKDKGYI